MSERTVHKEKEEEESSELDKIRYFQLTLLQWFSKEGKNFAWRQEDDLYKLLIAEMMLQRTRASQVESVYLDFLQEFPDIQSLSIAKPEAISHFMARLGLYWKTPLIKDMAKLIVNEYEGQIPEDRESLMKIPGVGPYIADALLVFALGRRRTVIDSNVVRLVTRYFGIEAKGEMRRNSKFIKFCQSLSQDIDSSGLKKFNWALIDFPSLICRPKPLCYRCPLSKKCHFYKEEH